MAGDALDEPYLVSDKSLAEVCTLFEDSQSHEDGDKITVTQENPDASPSMSDGRLLGESKAGPSHSPSASNRSSTSSRERSRAPNFLQRPVSSHEDPALGFRYEKAKLTRALDFSVTKTKQQELTSSDQRGNPPSKQIQPGGTLPPAVSPNPMSLPPDCLIKVPFPKALDVCESKVVPSEPQDNDENRPEAKLSRDIQSSEEPKHLAPSHVCSAPSTPRPIENDGSYVLSGGLQRVRQASRSSSRARVSSLRGAQYANCGLRGAKKGKHIKERRSGLRVTGSTPEVTTNDYHDIQHRLILVKDNEIHKFKQMLGEKDYLIEQQETEIEEQKAEIDKLDASLFHLGQVYQETSSAVKGKDKHLKNLEKTKTALEGKVREYQAAEVKNAKMKSALEARVKKLGATVKGLCNDHNSLRDNAAFLSSQYDGLNVDKQSVRDSLAALQSNQEMNDAKSKQLVASYREHIESLNHTVAALQQKLVDRPSDQDITRGPDSHPEHELARLVTGQDLLRDAQTHGHDELISKLNVIVEKISTPARSQDLVDQRLTLMLKEILTDTHQLIERKTASPEDILKLQNQIDHKSESVKDSIKSFEQRFAEANTTQQKLFISSEEDFRKFVSKTAGNDTLREQITEHREDKATLKEQLFTKQTEIDKAYIEIQQLRSQDQGQRQRIDTLESLVAQGKTNPEDTAAFLLRMHDLELANISVLNEKNATQTRIDEANQDLQQKAKEIAVLNKSLEEVRDHLVRSKTLVEDLRTERVILEKKMEAQRAAEKQELIEVAARKAERLKQENQREKQRLTILVEDAEKRVQTIPTERNNVNEVARVTTELENARNSIETLEKEAEKQTRHATAFEHKLNTMTLKLSENEQLQRKAESLVARQRRELEDNDVKTRALQASLNRAELEIGAKDSKIRVLEQALKIQQIAIPVNDSEQSTNLPSAIVEDSQPRTMDEIMKSEQPSAGNGALDFDKSDDAMFEKYRGLFPPDTPVQNQEAARSKASDKDHRAQSLSTNTIQGRDDSLRSNARKQSPNDSTGKASQQASRLSKEVKSKVGEVDSTTQDSQVTHLSTTAIRGLKRDAITAGLGQSQSSQSRKSQQRAQGNGQGSITISPGHSRGLRDAAVSSTRLPSKPGRKSRKDTQIDARFNAEPRRR